MSPKPCPTPPHQHEIENLEATLQHRSNRLFRFWPIFAMCFFRTFFFSIYSLALPNYLIYEKEITPGLVGLISSISSIAYIVGPLVGRKLTNAWGIKNTMILSTTLSFLSIILSIFFVIPWVLLIVRALDGFVNGFFWPNAINLVSTWEKRYESTSSINFLSRFNNSWNFGLIGGYIFGYVFVQYLGNDFTVLIISAGFAFLMIPSALSLERCNDFSVIHNRAVVLQDFRLKTSNFDPEDSVQTKGLEEQRTNARIYKLAALPLILAYGGIFIYASAKSIIKFTIPYIFKNNSIDSSWVYFVVLFQQIMQITGLNIMSRLSTKKKGYFMGLGILISVTTVMIFTPNAIIFAILVISTGVAIGLMQGVTQRIVLDYSKHHNTTKYSAWNEMFSGISFGIMPTIAGFLLEINIVYDFVFLLIILVSVGLILLQASNRYVKKFEAPEINLTPEESAKEDKL